MIINYFNYTHIITLFPAALFIAVCYFSLRNRSAFAKETAMYILMGFNLTQHFFKFLIWPHLYGSGFGLINTAYNVCAILIISSPFVFVSKSNLLKQYITYVGTIGATVTLIVPYWFIGSTILTWEYARFWTCHTLLVATSLLPALWGLVEFDYRDGWKFGLVFLTMLTLILANNTVFLLVLGNATKDTLYDALLSNNALWMMGPGGGVEGFRLIFEALSPSFLLETETHPYIPVLWYAIPMYAMITVIGYPLGFLTDRKRLLGNTQTLIKVN